MTLGFFSIFAYNLFMMPIKYNCYVKLSITAFFIAFFAVSCAKSTQIHPLQSRSLQIQAKRPPLDRDLAALAPAALQQASWINMKDLRNSPLWPAIRSILETQLSMITGENGFSRISMSIIDSADEALSVSGHSEENTSDGFVSIIKGNFKSKQIVAQIAKLSKSSQNNSHGFEIVHLRNFAIFAPTDRTVVFTSDNQLKNSLNLTTQHGDSLRSTHGFKDMAKPSKGGAVIRYIKGDSTLNRSIFKGTPLSFFRWTGDIERFDSSLRIDSSIALNGTAVLDTANRASQAKKEVNRQLNSLTSNPLIALLGVKPLVKKLKINTNSKSVSVVLKLNSADVKKIIKLIEPIMQIRQMLSSD